MAIPNKLIPITILFFTILALQQTLISAHGGINHDDEHETGVNLHSKRLITVKLWSLAIFFLSTFIFGVSPYFLRWNEGFLVLGSQFAGGVFLGTSVLHFLSDSTSTFESLTEIEYPFSYLLACAGFLVTMFADCVVGYVANRSLGANNRVEIEQGKVEEEVKDDDVPITLHNSTLIARTSSIADTVLLNFALCFHSIFEGIAVGIAGKEEDVWKNLWTIQLHSIRSHSNGNSPTKNVTKEASFTNSHLLFRLCHIEPNRGWHWNRNRCNYRGACS